MIDMKKYIKWNGKAKYVADTNLVGSWDKALMMITIGMMTTCLKA